MPHPTQRCRSLVRHLPGVPSSAVCAADSSLGSSQCPEDDPPTQNTPMKGEVTQRHQPRLLGASCGCLPPYHQQYMLGQPAPPNGTTWSCASCERRVQCWLR